MDSQLCIVEKEKILEYIRAAHLLELPYRMSLHLILKLTKGHCNPIEVVALMDQVNPHWKNHD